MKNNFTKNNFTRNNTENDKKKKIENKKYKPEEKVSQKEENNNIPYYAYNCNFLF